MSEIYTRGAPLSRSTGCGSPLFHLDAQSLLDRLPEHLWAGVVNGTDTAMIAAVEWADAPGLEPFNRWHAEVWMGLSLSDRIDWLELHRQGVTL